MTATASLAPVSKWAHLSFLISMVGKGALGAAQIAGGLALALTPAGTLNGIVVKLAKLHLIEDPSSFMATWALDAASGPYFANETFYTLYLLIHGTLNLGLVLALLAGFLWAYPVSLLSLFGFIAYQLNKFAQTGDIIMIALTLIDILVIWLVWREWQTDTRISP